MTPDARYQLFESGGEPALRRRPTTAPTCSPTPSSTGSATCIRVDAAGAPWPDSGFSDGINGGVNVPLGYRVACTLVNQTAQLTLLKHVVNDNGGSLTAEAWNLTGTPATLAGLSATTVGGSETAVAASTFGVRPRHVYTLTESASRATSSRSCSSSWGPCGSMSSPTPTRRLPAEGRTGKLAGHGRCAR